jgi:NAD(P)-dependent dehydrogenase (short-subunit alcohol dehydrogenase family)
MPGVFEGQVAIVTGGASGIGRAICEKFAAGGARVAVVDQHLEGARETLALLDTQGVALEADVARVADVERVVAAAVKELGPPDIMVNNAGVSRGGRIQDISDEDWELPFAVNLKGTFYFCRQVVPLMVERRYGRIVNIASGTAVRVGPGTSPYAASKAGVIALTKSVAGEVARRGVTANVVAPGLTDTAMTRAQFGDEERLQEVAAQGGIANPMRVVIQPHDIAAAVAFLASPEARYITGQTLHVNAGSFMP